MELNKRSSKNEAQDVIVQSWKKHVLKTRGIGNDSV